MAFCAVIDPPRPLPLLGPDPVTSSRSLLPFLTCSFLPLALVNVSYFLSRSSHRGFDDCGIDCYP